jgi:branched-chain amino acid transport system substrate-binding protein
VARAGSADPDKVLAALPGVRIDGVTGTLGYPSGSRIPIKPVAVVAIDGGKRHLVTTLAPTSVPPP